MLAPPHSSSPHCTATVQRLLGLTTHFLSNCRLHTNCFVAQLARIRGDHANLSATGIFCICLSSPPPPPFFHSFYHPKLSIFATMLHPLLPFLPMSLHPRHPTFGPFPTSWVTWVCVIRSCACLPCGKGLRSKN